MENLKIKEEFIKLDQFLKLANIVQSGGEAKVLIKNALVRVNGMVELQRGKKLKPGDIVEVDEKTLKVIKK
jgi:ribosome-associated protein